MGHAFPAGVPALDFAGTLRVRYGPQTREMLDSPESLGLWFSDPECTQLYVDRSRGARREWCGTDPCGNKIKAAAYRARKRAGASQRPAPAYER